MKLLITGGAGFIGSNYVRWLLAHSDDAVVVYDALTYAGNRDNLRDFEDDPRFEFIHGDVCDRDGVVGAMAAVMRWSTLQQRAMWTAPSWGPDAFVRTNCDGTNVVCDTARMLGVGRWCRSPPTRCMGRSRRALSPRPIG